MQASVREQRNADRRARELYHYFQPDNPALLPPRDTRGSFSASTVKSSPNLVLTALTQLAAVKLGVQRAIISLIDRETLYVVAEASRSLHLGSFDAYDDDGDGLWMGCSRGPVAGTLCEKTITLHPTPERKYPFFVVDDLRLHPVYRNLPCVAKDPFFRFYAGTPLTTANGINIGSLYVIDPRPDLRLTEAHRETLGTIADAVMDYMETSRQSLEADRLTRLLSGLSSFVQGEDNSDPPHKSPPCSAASSEHDRSRTPSPHQGDEHTAASSPLRGPQRSLPSPAISQSEYAVDPANDALPVLPSVPHIAPSQHGPAYTLNPTSNRVHRTFQRAARLMRQSLGLGPNGGVMIVDTNVRAQMNALHGVGRHHPRRKSVKVCALEDADATSIGSDIVRSSLPATNMDLSFARRIVRRYRRGGLWYFHQDGTAFSSDEDEISSMSKNDFFPPFSIHPQSFGQMSAKDLKAMKKYFPSASKIIFVPLWDSFSSRWFGGCFIWSSLETRVFSAHVDLGGLFGFGSSLMVEYSRILSQDSDKKKADFISTISHELRSPLHGILAANDFLAEYVKSESASRLLDTIRSCGQTLLDTFEQILDYSKINSFATKQQSLRSEKTPAHPLHMIKSVNVVELVEEVVESVFAGQILSAAMTGFGSSQACWSLHNKNNPNAASEVSVGGHVDLVLDVAPGNWEFILESGALRRIVMNVLGNALKYTQQGTVAIGLEIQEEDLDTDISQAFDGRPSTQVLLITVSDTGKGISADYLQSHVFTPFSQEDGLSPGTGLGLSLVHSILRSLGGKIAIESEVGVGTTVKIAFPVSQSLPRRPSQTQTPRSSSLARSSGLVATAREILQGKILQVAPPQDAESVVSPSTTRIKYYLTEWFGMVFQSDEATAPADIVIVDEHQSQVLGKSPSSLLLILCHQGPRSWSANVDRNSVLPKAVRITLPCGPYQLARALVDYAQGARLDSSPIIREHSAEHDGYNPKKAPLSSPLVEDNSLGGVTNNVHNLQVSPNGSKPRPRILLVEDNAINLALLEKIIARTKPEALDTAVNGKEAVDTVRATTSGYQYIFMDMSMPVMDGFEATRMIRSIERMRQEQLPAKIIALTGLGSNEHIAMAYEAGVDLFLMKPFSFKKILHLLREDGYEPEESSRTPTSVPNGHGDS
ncbi:Hybrid signal transduction histidine kinase J [Penicillium rolfsii]|nr:Hybrid signal transduction histidine kinase J [Penicillium rolfsii]